MAEENEKPEVVAKSPFDMKMLIVFGLVIVLAVGATTFAVVKFLAPPAQQSAASTEAKTEVASGSGSLINFSDDIITNLADKDEQRYVKFKLALEVSDKTLAAKEKVTELEPPVKYTVLQILRKKTTQDVKGSDGFTKLAKDLKDQLNKDVFHGKLQQVYISEFVVQ